jgi:hypothetical protein
LNILKLNINFYLKMKTVFFFVTATLLSYFSYAQDGWNWGNDVSTAKEKNAYYTDVIKQADTETDNAKKLAKYNEAIEPLEWLLTNTPDLNKAIYINGLKVYQNLAYLEGLATPKDVAKIEKYQDRALQIIDTRIAKYGEKEKVLAIKAELAYGYLATRKPQRYDELNAIYKEIYTTLGENTSPTAIYYYMAVITTQYQAKKVSEDEFLATYESLIKTLQAQGQKDATKKKTTDDISSKIDDLFAKSGVKLGCEYVRNKLGAKLKAGADLETAKKAVKYMVNDNCMEDPLFVIATKTLYENEPSIGIAKIIAGKFKASKQLDSAEVWYEKGVELAKADEGEKKAEALMELAKLAKEKGQKSKARAYALKAADAHAGAAADAYTFVGNLYYGSGSDCTTPGDQVKSRAVYLAAYDMFQRAGNTASMKSAAQHFPSMEDIFTKGMKEGESIEVGCWIGGTTTLRKRP